MATTSTFFNNFGHTESQRLLDSLVVESIRIYGQDVYYLPWRQDTFDNLLSEDDTNYYDTAYAIPMYLKNAEGFINPEALMTNFGLEIRPNIIMSVARFEFDNEITTLENAINRPREGDLIYFPLNKRIFQINYVDDKPFFYQHGKLQMYDLTCELYEYSNERFQTGLAEIDDLWTNFSFNAYDYAILTSDGKAIATSDMDIITRSDLASNQDAYDPLADNDEIEIESDRDNANNSLSVIDWSETNPWAESDDGKY